MMTAKEARAKRKITMQKIKQYKSQQHFWAITIPPYTSLIPTNNYYRGVRNMSNFRTREQARIYLKELQMHGVNHEMRDKYRVVKVKMIIKK